MALLTNRAAIQRLQAGEVIAYPTESVFGLGCDPDNAEALRTLLQLKQRPEEKGLILIADTLERCLPYIDITPLTQAQIDQLTQPNGVPTTWLVPKAATLSPLISGQFECVAIRLSTHPIVCQLTQHFGKPIISTSANRSGETPCKTVESIEQQFGQDFPILIGDLGRWETPSRIYDLRTGQRLR